MERDHSDAEDLLKVEECLRGDERAFEHLFDKYREKVYSIAYRFVHDKEDALEVTQEVFLRVHQSLPGFKTDSKFFTWLYRITVNRAIDFARARRSRRTVGLGGGGPGEAAGSEGDTLVDRLPDQRSDDPAELILRKELAGKLLEAVEALSPKHRAVFVLHAMGDFSYKEIAEVVGTSLGTVMSRLFYARRKLRQLLGGYGKEAPSSRVQ